MRNVTLLFLLFFCIHNSDAFLSYCMRAFSSEKDFFSSIYDQVNNPLTKTLIDSYQVAYELKLFDGKRQVKEFSEGLKDMVEFLERSPTQKEREVLNNLNISIDMLIYRTSEIMEFVKQSSPEEALYFSKVTQAVFSIFSKYLPVILKQDLHQTEWSKVNLILQEVVNFDSRNPKFSLYKIERTIERWYSLREWILCRM